jgi:glucose-6-phosphate dehydrogenase assembly protein OpcA
MGAPQPVRALEARAANFHPGDTDLTWTRVTPWRALLAGSLDQHEVRVTHVVVSAAENNAAGMLLAAWLENRLGCVVDLVASDGPGVTSVQMQTDRGDISVKRTDGRMALYEAPGTPARTVALRRRDITALLAEELRRLDPDEVLHEASKQLLVRCGQGRGRPRRADTMADSAGGTQED